MITIKSLTLNFEHNLHSKWLYFIHVSLFPCTNLEGRRQEWEGMVFNYVVGV